jgi:hypothetical protein
LWRVVAAAEIVTVVAVVAADIELLLVSPYLREPVIL